MSTPFHKNIEDRFAIACELHARSEFAAAEKIYIGLLARVPEAGLLHYNIGLLYYQTEDFDKALVHYSVARKLAPRDPDLLCNYALCQKKLGQLLNAAASFKELTRISPNDPDGFYNLGNCYRELREYEHAVETFQQVLIRKPSHLSANRNLAYVYHLLGEIDNALVYYTRVRELDPDDPQAIHMIAAITGEDIGSASSLYVKDIFNSYSDTFDETLLGNLHYAVPEKLRSLFDTLKYPVKLFSKCIDLGCGTGLAGSKFSDLCKNLAGIDLSEGMIEKAKQKDIYDSLQVAEITTFLKSKRNEYDLVVAADVLTYMGDLDPVFATLTAATTKHALFCFSTENSRQPHFHLCPTGRFAHSRNYVSHIAAQHGWRSIDMVTTNLRKEKSNWVEGTLYFFEKM